jgi:hypothetical protein
MVLGTQKKLLERRTVKEFALSWNKKWFWERKRSCQKEEL